MKNQTIDKIKTCPKCNTENRLENNFCRFCGEKFNEPPKNIKRYKFRTIASICTIICISVGITGGMIYHSSNSNITANTTDVTYTSETEQSLDKSETSAFLEEHTEETDDEEISESDIETEYDENANTLFRNGMLAVCDNSGKWGYIGTNMNYIIEPQFSYANDFSKIGLACVADENEKYGYIDKNGNYVIAPQFTNAFDFTDTGIAKVKIDDTYTWIDKNGNIVNKPNAEDIYNFDTCGLSVQCIGENMDDIFADHNYKYGYIDKTGNFIIEPIFSMAKEFTDNGLALVCDSSGKYGYIDKSGNYIIEPQFDYASNFSENGLAAVGEMSMWNDDIYYGYIDSTGKYMIEPEFSYVTDFDDKNYALVGMIDYNRPNQYDQTIFDNKYGVIDTYGNIVLDFDYGYLSHIDDYGFAMFQTQRQYDGGPFGLLNINGDIIIPEYNCSSVTHFNNGLAAARVTSDDVGYINTDGDFVIEQQYIGGSMFYDDGYAIVEKDNFSSGHLYSIINTNGDIMISNLSDVLLPQYEDSYHNCFHQSASNCDDYDIYI